MPYGPTSSPLPLNAPQMQFPGGGADAQRDSITQALMNIQNPRPHTQVPPGMGAAPQTPSPQGADGGVPGAGAPPVPGVPGQMPGAGMQPGGLGPMSMNQTMQPGGVMPGGPQFAPPPQVGIPPPQQSPQMPPPIGGQQQPPY